MNFLSIDVGTTLCKCQLFSESGEILEYLAEEYAFLKMDGKNYVNVDEMKEKLFSMIKSVGEKHEISSIAVSTLGESFVLLDKDENVLFYPMLYTDPRGAKEAEYVSELLGADAVFRITGTVPHSMYSLSKLLMIKNDYPDIYEKAEHAMLMCDYVGFLLTGERVIDYSLAARTGAFDVNALCFSDEILSPLGIEKSLFSEPKRAGSTVAPLKKDVCERLGLRSVPTLVLGSHDQVCTTLGAGALDSGDAVDGLGTVECITVLFDKADADVRMGMAGYPVVPFAKEGLFCTYMLNYSAGSSVNWIRKNIMHGYSGEEEDFFAYMEKNMPSEPSGLLTLPYLGGAATPYQDIDARGAVIGISTETTDAELYRSLLEGTAMEMRLNAEFVKDHGITLKSAVATGGGANSKSWIKIKADVQNIPIKVLRSSEGGLCGCAMLQATALGRARDLYEARDIFVKYAGNTLPDAARHASYEEQYQRYKKIYKAIKEI
ncbi:MAG: hypothetical protein IKB38_01335 [Clostridia bacterium]|nr:hypothetical protein [Clostridia bacterium]